jgi:hypothetical protein
MSTVMSYDEWKAEYISVPLDLIEASENYHTVDGTAEVDAIYQLLYADYVRTNCPGWFVQYIALFFS